MTVKLAERTVPLPAQMPISRWPMRDRRIVLYCVSLLLDCLALAGGYHFAATARGPFSLMIGEHALILVALPIFVMLEIAREVQSAESFQSSWLGLMRALSALGMTALGVVMLTFLINEENLSRISLVLFFAFSAVGLVASKLITHLLVRRLLKGKAIAELLLLDDPGVEPPPGMDFVDVGSQGLWPDLYRPDVIDALSRIVACYDRVVVASVPEHREAWTLFLKASDVGGEILIDQSSLQGAVAIGECGDNDTLVLSRGPLSLSNRIQKRALDLVLVVPLLVILAPLMVLVAIAIRLDSPGPVIFSQIRVGQGNRQFRMFKFRSMRIERTDGAGARSTSRDDDRVTRVGRIIRRTSIDELPQLINVLKGDMSIVGPRPHALGSLAGDELFWEVTTSYWLRHALKPGITGLAQVRGFRGATGRHEDLTDRLRADLEYVTTWTVWLDISILLRTTGVLIHHNAY